MDNVSGYSMSHKPCPLHVSGRDMDQTKKVKVDSIV